MNSLTCCVSRHPPSPDGGAPKPVIKSTPAFKLSDRPESFNPVSWSPASRISRPEDAAAIQAIFEKDKSSHCDDHSRIVSKRSSATLIAVRSRLKKHLSKDSGFANTKRNSRASVGTSEEEVERRAELRRIRHKRIRDELSLEGVYDDDAKSLSTLEHLVAPRKAGLNKRASWAAGDLQPLPSLTSPDLPIANSPPSRIEIPPTKIFNQKGPTLEALYFGLTSPQIPATKHYSDTYFTEWSETMVNSSTYRSRRHSSPAVSPRFEIEEPEVYQPTRKHSSIPPIPPAPIIRPQRLPSDADGKSSWRLSFSAVNRGDQLRKLSQEGGLSVLLGSDKSIDGSQPTRKWLFSQGLRTTSQAVGCSENTSLEGSASHAQICLSSQEFGGVDGVGDSATILHLHEMGISQRLASRGLRSSCSSPQLSSTGSRTHQRDVSSISGLSRTTHKTRARLMQRNTTDSIPLSERIPELWGHILKDGENIQDGTSSFYPSANASIQPSRKSSKFSLLSMLPGRESKANLIDSMEYEEGGSSYRPLSDSKSLPQTTLVSVHPRTPVNRASIVVASASCESLPFTGCHRRPIDTNSTTRSETESFRQREIELSVVRTRFAAAEAKRTPSTPRSSRFREDFDFSLFSPKDTLPIRPSALTRLTKFTARSFDGPFERKPGFPKTPGVPGYLPNELQHHHQLIHNKPSANPALGTVDDGSVIGLWGNAVSRHANPKAKEVANNLHIPGTKLHHDGREKTFRELRKQSQASKESKDKKKKFALKGLGWGMGSDSDGESGKEDNPEDDWEAELAKVASKAKGKSRNIIKKPTEPDRRYPASWSKFSSHDRHERTSSADVKDRVLIKDFATDGSEFLDGGKKTLREKIQKRIIAELDKQATTEVQNNTQGTFGRRSSMRPAGDLEYPELEVLPLYNASLMSHEEIAEHVEEVLKEEELDKKAEELDAIFGPATRAQLKTEISNEVASKKLTGENTPNGSATATAGGSRTGAHTTDPKESPATPAKRGPTARRGPVARKPGEEPPKPKPGPKIAPPVVMPARGRAAGNAIGLMDGSRDDDGGFSIFIQSEDCKSEEDISFTDPRFYNECIIDNSSGPEAALCCEGRGEVSAEDPKKLRYRTWSGKDWDSIKRTAPKSRRSLGTVKLRKSTDEIFLELKKAEVAERNKVLKAAEEAFGG